MADVVTLMNSLEGEPVPRTAYFLREALPEVVELYGAAAGELSVNYYEEIRGSSSARSAYTPVARTGGLAALTQDAIGFTAAQLTNQVAFSTVVGTLAGNMQRAVNGVDRETLRFNIVTDPDGTLYQRVPSASACAFCRTVAVVAEPSEAYGEKYHSYCRCQSLPVFRGQSRAEVPGETQTKAAYDLANKELQRRREEVSYRSLKRNQAAKLYPDLTLTTENHLRLMRQITGWR
jgi:hypothetical protein